MGYVSSLEGTLTKTNMKPPRTEVWKMCFFSFSKDDFQIPAVGFQENKPSVNSQASFLENFEDSTGPLVTCSGQTCEIVASLLLQCL